MQVLSETEMATLEGGRRDLACALMEGFYNAAISSGDIQTAIIAINYLSANC